MSVIFMVSTALCCNCESFQAHLFTRNKNRPDWELWQI